VLVLPPNSGMPTLEAQTMRCRWSSPTWATIVKSEHPRGSSLPQITARP
jgi:hypothetical protein